MLPPRQTPHSTNAPGMPWSATCRVASTSAKSFSCAVIVRGRTARMISFASVS
jgi:hypothetical protein